MATNSIFTVLKTGHPMQRFFLCLFLFVLTACSTDELKSRLTGTWIITSIDCPQFGGDTIEDLVDYTDYGTYQFRSDGTLVVRNNILQDFFPNGTYTWELRRENETSTEPLVDRLYIESTGFFQTEIGVSEMVLSNQAVDGCRYEFRKVGGF